MRSFNTHILNDIPLNLANDFIFHRPGACRSRSDMSAHSRTDGCGETMKRLIAIANGMKMPQEKAQIVLEVKDEDGNEEL